ncbi:MFS transporter [Streptomyces shenzhenensis]|uniref:MFS transporter n=1 Tax=Streptomyces shenzhenensis TaxID=943815 RepID=UPI00340BFB9A
MSETARTASQHDAAATAHNERMARRAGVGAFVGTTVEMYDFYVFSTASALVFGKLFFPSDDPTAGTLAAFVTIWAGYISRPLGGILFGHLGDRVGRKKVLVLSLILTGVATALIGVLPTYAQIGVAAPTLLVVIRCIQGVALGGEWGGAVLIATEHAPPGKKILYGAFAQQGSPTGNLLSTLVFMVLALMPESAFDSWGWRIPFLLAALLVSVGIVIRLRLEESPEITELLRTSEPVKLPLAEVVRSSPLVLVLALTASAIAMAGNFLITTFTLSWATTQEYFDRSTYLSILMIVLLVQLMVQPLTAIRSTRWRMTRAIPFILLPQIVLLPLMFTLVSTGNFLLATLGLVGATIPHAMYYAVFAGMLSQVFPVQIRYTGISLAYQTGTALFAGTTPMLCQYFYSRTGSVVPVIVLGIAYTLLSVGSAIAMLRRFSERPAVS